ncbi:ABC transporter permease [Bosea sp. (in: a-proteobacteria)]|uniref:ABC transporter permease n=1 Tax=Bosea sp. (in: a-proteobacteria) TaxID=1871050 RepID=UPI00261E3A7A|nr:ABC transporter permease subunit [Bosea sp. (in: a-proteobacteria)]MCO5092177.1 ABC transporter permease subunit [Bosea sp. (in: a-proteobacteria)]
MSTAAMHGGSTLSRSNQILAHWSVRAIFTGLLVLVLTIAVLFTLVPAALVVVLSFSNEKLMIFPPREWGFRQYEILADAKFWLTAVRTSFGLALSSAMLALAVAVPAAIALNRGQVWGRQVLAGVGLAPLILPGVAYAVSVYMVFLQARVMGSPFWVVLVYATHAFPYVLLIVGTAINRIPKELELVAMTLGASKTRATVNITARLLVQAMAAAFVFAFIGSFDESTLIVFIGGPGLVTLPKGIFDSLRTGMEPVVLAISTILMVFTGILAAVASYWRSNSTR